MHIIWRVYIYIYISFGSIGTIHGLQNLGKTGWFGPHILFTIYSNRFFLRLFIPFVASKGWELYVACGASFYATSFNAVLSLNNDYHSR